MTLKPTSPTSTSATGVHKRRRRNANDDGSHIPPPSSVESPTTPVQNGCGGGSGAVGGAGGASSFRNVSACNRCRVRKNRCDQRLPSCLSCEKAKVKCVGFDPITRTEIPRSYVHYLEARVAFLESLLRTHNIAYPAPESFSDLPPPPHSATIPTPTNATAKKSSPFPAPTSPHEPPIDPALIGDAVRVAQPEPRLKRQSPIHHADSLEERKLDSLVSDIGLVSFAGASDPRYLGSVSGISFARVVFSALRSSTNNTGDRNGGGNGGDFDGAPGGRYRSRLGSSARMRGSKGLGVGAAAVGVKEEPTEDDDDDTQTRDSFFGLHTKPTITPAPFPSRRRAEKLVNLYFEHANPQVPVLHRGEFMAVLDKVYGGTDGGNQNGYGVRAGPREKYLVNILCAIGTGIFLTGPSSDDEEEDEGEESDDDDTYKPNKRTKTDSDTEGAGRNEEGHNKRRGQKYYEPESYHASAIVHLEAFLSHGKGGLEDLQAVLLLAGYALLRPVAPGLWYIVGVAVRLAVDLGLHYEDTDAIVPKSTNHAEEETSKHAREEWMRDLRRRLWWCVYSLDRLVSTCVGRPCGIADESISTQFPSLLDDEYIHPITGITPPPYGKHPSYKLISLHYIRLRLLQSEILHVLQHPSHNLAFSSSACNPANPCVEATQHLPSSCASPKSEKYPFYHPFHLKTPYLQKFPTIQCWHKDIDRRLQEWKDSAPKSKEETGVAFSLEFLELNYWQAKLMLYRPCLFVPVLLTGELGGSGGNSRGRAAEKGLGAGNVVCRDKVNHEEAERVFLVVAEAGSKVLKLYRHLHRFHQVNYTYLATHHLFMAGIAYLYAIWHSPAVRSRLEMDDVDFTIFAATSVLGDLVDKCPPAVACRDAFERMSRTVVQMCLGGKRGPASKISPSGTSLLAGTSMEHDQRYPQNYTQSEEDRKSEPSKGGEELPKYLPQQYPHQQQRAQLMTQYDAEVSSGYPQHMPMKNVRHQQQSQQSQQQPQVMQRPRVDQFSNSTMGPKHHSQQMPQRRRPELHFDEGFTELFTPSASEMRPQPQQQQSAYIPHHAPQNPYNLSPQQEVRPFHPPLAYNDNVALHSPDHSRHHGLQSFPGYSNSPPMSHSSPNQPQSDEMMIDPALQRDEVIHRPPNPHHNPQLQHQRIEGNDAQIAGLVMGEYEPDANSELFMATPGFDFELDAWSDHSGNQVDLFDGFFFGGGMN